MWFFFSQGDTHMTSEAVQKRIAVIGGGLAGLTAACYLARGGAAVTLFERAPRLGGHAISVRDDGWLLNLGPHAFYSGGAGSEVLGELRVAYRYAKPGPTAVVSGKQFAAFPAGPRTLARANLGGRDLLDFFRLFAGLLQISPRTLASTSVQTWIAGASGQPRIRRLLVSVARPFVYSAALDLVSAEVFVDKLQRAMRHPVHYVEGGWQSLVDGLRAAAERAGVRILRGARVEAVRQEAGSARGVTLHDGRLVPADAVVVATRPGDALKLFEGASHELLRAAVEGLLPARVATLDIGVQGLPAPRHPIVFDLEQPLFLTTQSLSISIAPQGGTLLSAFKQLDPREPVDAEASRRDLEGLVERVQPGWRAALAKHQFLPQIEATGALPLARSGGFAGRPKAQAPGLANCFLAGDWVGERGFLADASFASGREAALLALRAAHASQLAHADLTA
jgi:phytoene dehydrogenase-like protein